MWCVVLDAADDATAAADAAADVADAYATVVIADDVAAVVRLQVRKEGC